ncbi:MAG: glycoside hydrolase family 15 protein [Polyangiales bacterium]
MRLEDYAIVGDTQTLLVVGKSGSIDWLCLPRFDSPACFASLLGTKDNGRFLLAPRGEIKRVSRRYRENSLVLETEMETEDGVVRIVDAMPIRGEYPDVVRIVEGVRGRVPMHLELVIRFDYGSVLPWVRTIDGRLHAVAGPDALVLVSAVPTRGEGFTTVADFVVEPGDRVPFVLTWHPSHLPTPENAEPFSAIEETDVYWRAWADRCTYRGPYREHVVRSLITLKALTYGPTGGIVAAGTTSLPEHLGGVRNWDYRYCWLRDATFTLYCMLHAGYREEAAAWRDWLLRAVAGDPGQLQIMYGLAGERRLDERVLESLEGYENSRPVRIGNAAARQLQLDVHGEVIDTLYQARRLGIAPEPASWAFERAVADWLANAWKHPDEGLWEVRGPRRNFVPSKVMAWVAIDRMVKQIENQGASGPLERLRAIRGEIHRDVLDRGWNEKLGSFTQFYGSNDLDASLLLIPAVGFLPGNDPRVLGTIAAIERQLLRDGFLQRYPTDGGKNVDGLPGGEGAFVACSFWLVDAYVLCGRREEARRLFERLIEVCNDVGLLSEEYDVSKRRLVGNFPQAFSHVALVNSALNLSELQVGPSGHRPTG